MQFWQIIFLLSCVIVLYNYAGYAVLAHVINKLTGRSGKPVPDPAYQPAVSFIVAAYNEEDVIRMKIRNSLEQDYPRHLIEFIFITDGSTDHTPSIIGEYPEIRLLHSPQRPGKSAALNRAVSAAQNDILIFSDANTILNKEATAFISRHYCDPRTGGVSGEKKVISAESGNDPVSEGEGIYWKYESFLKKIDSDFHSVVGAAGELFSVRRGLYTPIASNIILDDFIISLRTAQAGYRVVYEPDAFAMELASVSLAEEQKRKVRIAAGGFQSIVLLKSLLIFWRHPRLSFLYISHRLLRWTLSPISLIMAFVSNAILFYKGAALFFTITFLLQVLFYGMAFAGYLLQEKKIRLLKLPYYFTFMNISVIRGFFRFLSGSQSALWEKAKRLQTTENEPV